MTELVLAMVLALLAAVCAAMYFRLRSRRAAVSSLETLNLELSSRARFLADRSRQGIVMFDARGLIRRVNPAAEKMFGYCEVELLGQSFLRLVPESPAGRGGEAEVRRKDGSRVRRRFTTGRLGNAESPEVYLFFDEEDSVRATPPPQRNEKQDQAPQPVERMPVEDVVNRIVRAFEGLLTTISGYTELALHGTSVSSPIRKDLEEVAAASDAASNLARNLLAYSGRQTIPLESIDLNALVGALEGELRQAMQSPFHVSLATERPTVLANGDCLGQILMILCTSAHHRAHRSGEVRRGAGKVEIRTEKRKLAEPLAVYTGKVPAGIYSVLSVSDSGPVIESATLAHVFEPLFLDRDAFGVELAPVHGIVRNLGGWIDVTSQEKTGTKFEVLFPYAGDFQVGKAAAKGSLVG
jgi:two-component system cell cycle sensor histidine kinase/response regulator CckA